MAFDCKTRPQLQVIKSSKACVHGVVRSWQKCHYSACKCVYFTLTLQYFKMVSNGSMQLLMWSYKKFGECLLVESSSNMHIVQVFIIMNKKIK